MEKLKRYKGITLISLVVTTIILIILAGISISMILGNEGLLNKAKYATESYSNAQQKEELELAKYSNNINSYVSGNRDYTPISYSTEEQDTGMKWIDGKTIYQKTMSITNQTVTANVWFNLGATDFPSNVETIVDAKFIRFHSDTSTYGIAKMDEVHPKIGTTNGLFVYDSDGTNHIEYATILYTKKIPTTNE